MSYYLAHFVSWLCCHLPGSFCDWLGRCLGQMTWPLVPAKRRRMARENIQRCLATDEQETGRIARASWVRFGPMIFEVLRFPVIKRQIDRYVEIEGAENLRQGLALGRGAVIASAHSGNWELMGGALAARGFPIVGVAMRQKEAGMDRFINDYRRLVGMHITYKDDVREMFSMLKKGWAIGLLMDQDSSVRDGIVLDWFGQPTNFVQGPATLARFKNAPLIPGFITRKADGRHKIILFPPLFVPHTSNKREDIRQAMEQLSIILEQYIRQHPEEWFWLHDRWKSMRNRVEPHRPRYKQAD